MDSTQINSLSARNAAAHSTLQNLDQNTERERYGAKEWNWRSDERRKSLIETTMKSEDVRESESHIEKQIETIL